MNVQPTNRRFCVLVVEDDDDIRGSLQDWLSQTFEVATARDGQEGLEIASARYPAPDVVITDVGMPRLDGFGMVHCMQQHDWLRDVPIIFLTAQTSPRMMVTGIAAGARAYLPKPVDLAVLDRKLKSALLNARADSRHRVA